MDQLSKLIVKDLFGCLSECEQAHLAEQIRELKIDEETYLQMKRRIADPELRMRYLAQTQPAKATTPRWRLVLRYAAMLALPVCAATYFLFQGISGQPEVAPVVGSDPFMELAGLVPERKQPQLVLDDGSVMNLDTDTTLHVIAGNIVHSAGSISYKNYETVRLLPQAAAVVAKPVYNTLSTPEGGDYKVILADGTVISLNEKSVLRYPTEFVGDTREVYLVQGEMYFEVAKNASKPFVVHTVGGSIRVLGTRFNISASERIVTTLVEGSVAVCSDNQRMMLKPNQQASFSRDSGPIRVEEVRDVEELICWKDNVFYFNDKTLEQILDKVSVWYGFSVRYDEPQLKNNRYFVYIDKYSDLKTILTLLSNVGAPRLKIEGRTIIVD